MALIVVVKSLRRMVEMGFTKEIVWVFEVTLNDTAASAAVQFELPSCDAMIEHVPIVTNVTVDPETVQTEEVFVE